MDSMLSGLGVRGLIVEIEGALGDTLSEVLKAKSSIPVVNGKNEESSALWTIAVSEQELPSDGDDHSKEEDVSEMGEDDDKNMDDDDEGMMLNHCGMEGIELDGKEGEEESTEIFIQGVHRLHDSFFSIDEFNRQTDYNGWYRRR